MLYTKHPAGVDDSPMYWEAEAFDHPKICPKSEPKPAPNISKCQSHLIRKHIIPNQFPKHHTTGWRWVDLLECQSRIPEKATPIFLGSWDWSWICTGSVSKGSQHPHLQVLSVQSIPKHSRSESHSARLFPESRSKVRQKLRLGRNQKRCTTWRQKLPNVRF